MLDEKVARFVYRQLAVIWCLVWGIPVALSGLLLFVSVFLPTHHTAWFCFKALPHEFGCLFFL